jgi:hypothetical protein
MTLAAILETAVSDTTDITVQILRQIRDEIVATRTDLGARIDATCTSLGERIDETNTRLGGTNSRLDTVETTLLELAEQQRFVVRHLGVLTTRDRKLEDDVDQLRARVDAIEARLEPAR